MEELFIVPLAAHNHRPFFRHSRLFRARTAPTFAPRSRPVVRPEASTASDGVGARPGEDVDDDYGGGGVDAGGSKSDLRCVSIPEPYFHRTCHVFY